MFNHYGGGDKITSYTFVKERTYRYEQQAINVENNLNILKHTKFDFVCVPYFEYERNSCDLKIESEFIKGFYSHEMGKIYDDLVSKNWTFGDPSPWNFMQCTKTHKTYIVDIDSFIYCPDFDIRNDFWIKKYKDWEKVLLGNPKKLKKIEKSC